MAQSLTYKNVIAVEESKVAEGEDRGAAREYGGVSRE